MMSQTITYLLLLGMCLVALVPTTATADEQNEALSVAETFIDAFYSFDADNLAQKVVPGVEADAVSYYQAWAEAAHYTIVNRESCQQTADDTISCAITVTDDFGSALGYQATDTFTLKVSGDQITAVAFEGDDPPVFYVLYVWIAIFHSDILEGPCDQMFEGGKTPADCARAFAGAAGIFQAGGRFYEATIEKPGSPVRAPRFSSDSVIRMLQAESLCRSHE